MCLLTFPVRGPVTIGRVTKLIPSLAPKAQDHRVNIQILKSDDFKVPSQSGESNVRAAAAMRRRCESGRANMLFSEWWCSLLVVYVTITIRPSVVDAGPCMNILTHSRQMVTTQLDSTIATITWGTIREAKRQACADQWPVPGKRSRTLDLRLRRPQWVLARITPV